MELDNQKIEDDFSPKEMFRILIKYSWVIFITIIVSIFIASIDVYFKKPLYSAYSIVKVKEESESLVKNLALNPKLEIIVNIDEDIALLKTFYMNNNAITLNKDKFKVQYFLNKGYKSIEIYKQVPIKIENIKNIDNRCIGNKLRITPISNRDEYYIDFVHSFIDKLMSKLFNKPLLKIEKKSFKYNEEIKTKFFILKVNKLSNFNKPIDILINGDNRYIYNNIISNNLNIVQMNEKVPLIKIYYQDRVPSRAVSYIEALTQSFINDNLSENNKQTNQILNFITNELEKIKKELKNSEIKLKDYRVLNRAVEPSIQASTFIKKLSSIDFSISENKLRVHIINNLVKFIETNHNLDAISPALTELKDTTTLKLTELLNELQLKKNELLVDLTPRHPKVIEIDSKINIIKNKIVLNIKNMQKQILEKDKNLKKIKNSYEKRIEDLPEKERKIINIKRNYEVSSKMYNFLLEKQLENEILKVVNISKYKIIDKAYSTFSPIENKSKLILISSIFIGFFIGVVIITLYYIYSDKILTIKDIKSRTNTPIYGSIPSLKKDESEFIEKYSNLRTNLQLSENKFKTISLNSTVDYEDKEMVAINLSYSFSMIDYKTLIINLDMRNNRISRILDIDIDNGIGEYLNGTCSLDKIIYQTKHKNLDIITIGRGSFNISKLLLSKSLETLIDRLKINYDYIILNVTPFGLLTDTKHIMKISDINLVVFKEAYSHKEYLASMNQMKEQNGITNLGVVFLENS